MDLVKLLCIDWQIDIFITIVPIWFHLRYAKSVPESANKGRAPYAFPMPALVRS